MKSPQDTLKDLLAYKSGLARMHETIDTCNELRTYVFNIIDYIKDNDVDKGRHDPFAPQLDTNVCNIIPTSIYGVKSSKSQRVFRTCKHEVEVTLGVLISHLEGEIEGINAIKN